MTHIGGMPTMFYCGCHRDSGHYLWNEDGDSSSWFWKNQPWGYDVDGKLQPFPRGGFIVPNGHARLTHAHGWTALSWWDNSIDTRPGSHSTFVALGTHAAETMLAMARARFPWVFERLKYEIVLSGGDK
jgi:hypothetical protein